MKSFNASQKQGEILYQRTNDLYDAEIGILQDEILWSVPPGLVAAICSTVAIIIGAIRMDAGAISSEGLLFVLLLVREALRLVTDLRQTIHFSFTGMGAAEGVLNIMGAVPLAVSSTKTSTTSLPSSFSFEGVTFRYRKRHSCDR